MYHDRSPTIHVFASAVVADHLQLKHILEMPRIPRQTVEGEAKKVQVLVQRKRLTPLTEYECTKIVSLDAYSGGEPG